MRSRRPWPSSSSSYVHSKRTMSNHCRSALVSVHVVISSSRVVWPRPSHGAEHAATNDLIHGSDSSYSFDVLDALTIALRYRTFCDLTHDCVYPGRPSATSRQIRVMKSNGSRNQARVVQRFHAGKEYI